MEPKDREQEHKGKEMPTECCPECGDTSYVEGKPCPACDYPNLELTELDLQET